MKENINALDEIHKGACMGVDAISKVLEKVFDPKLKNVLENQEKSYQKIKKEIKE